MTDRARKYLAGKKKFKLCVLNFNRTPSTPVNISREGLPPILIPNEVGGWKCVDGCITNPLQMAMAIEGNSINPKLFAALANAVMPKLLPTPQIGLYLPDGTNVLGNPFMDNETIWDILDMIKIAGRNF